MSRPALTSFFAELIQINLQVLDRIPAYRKTEHTSSVEISKTPTDRTGLMQRRIQNAQRNVRAYVTLYWLVHRTLLRNCPTIYSQLLGWSCSEARAFVNANIKS